jgi:4-amino-4-deoxy-L-arabinose transferase-like glycosyltransferase
MFAEPAREMEESRDWVTPHMNGEPFLTKPPLMYWLPAVMFVLVGPTEYARLWSVLAALATVLVTGMLGQELFDEMTGLTAAIILVSMFGFFIEARFLRADMLLVLTVTLALYYYVRLRRGAGVATAAAFWTTLGVGTLDKGLVALVLVGSTCAVVEIVTGKLQPNTVGARLRALYAPWGLLLAGCIILPWHLGAAVKNPGFLWDYIINQHVLFFFDKKLPRDSIPDSLGFFWAMFFARGLPWSLLLPAAVVHNWSQARVAREPDSMSSLPLLWLIMILGFFSLVVSRLEHYCLPALPAVALLVGSLLADLQTGHVEIASTSLAAPILVVAFLVIVFTSSDPSKLLGAIDPLLPGYELEKLVRPAALTIAIGLLGIALLFIKKRYRAGFGVGVATAVVLLPFIQMAHERVEPLFSWRPFARLIRETAPGGSRVFFRAEDEYQLCGGLNYYLGRRLDLLEPPGWTPPTFLEDRTNRLFTPHVELEQNWRTHTSFLVSDSVHGPEEELRLAPGPYTIVSRAGERVLLRSVAPGDNSSAENSQPSIRREETVTH